MKKIAIIVPDINFTGGAEKVAINLYDLFQNSYNVTLISLFSNENLHPKLIFENKRNVIHLSLKKERSIIKRVSEATRNLRWLRQIFSEYEYILGNNVFRYYLPPPLFKCSKIIEIQHLRYEEEFEDNNSLQLLIRNYLYKYLHKVIVLTERDTNLFNKNGVKNTVTIPNFISNPSIVNRNPQKIVLSVGRLTSQKNHFSLLNIWAGVCATVTDKEWKLHIAGDGPLRHELIERAKTLGISESVIFHGNVDNIESLYANAYVVVSTSLYEGFPLTFLEAINFGIPIVTYNFYSGANELVRHNYNGIVTDVGDELDFCKKIISLLNNSDLAEEMSKNTITMKAKYDPTNIGYEWKNKVLL
ncbi:glycosyltransferase [Aeromonas sp. QDB07]|uniref:glycosyltransferase n=1 Tax=Aeromonas sp. QDB07 TaxID=2989838 RepID=UPI0022E3FD26|nr:glycosyltransferase [Aeromonas sp. QDB07]